MRLNKVLVKYMCNEQMNTVTNVWVTIERNYKVALLIRNSAQYFDTVEYNDGSYLDVYFDNGKFVGLEYDSNCKFVE